MIAIKRKERFCYIHSQLVTNQSYNEENLKDWRNEIIEILKELKKLDGKFVRYVVLIVMITDL